LKASPNTNLVTPIYLKTDEDMPWPECESVFHLLTGDGLFLCRNHPFFRSSTPVKGGPSELASHGSFIDLKYPRIPRGMYEQVVGYFYLVARQLSAEAAVLFAWNQTTEEVELIVPEQRSVVSCDWLGRRFPINVWYDIPPISDDLIIFGDAHCHVDGAAYASHTDIEDEVYRPGIHIVVGRIREDPPDLHIEVIVDGIRFQVQNREAVIEGYQRRRPEEVPQEWMDRITVVPWGKYGDAAPSSFDQK